jgi:anti-anti-sigma factor
MAFDVVSEVNDGIAKITMGGELDASVAGEFKSAIEEVSQENPTRLILMVDQLKFMASAGLRVLIFAKQKMGENVDIYVVAPQKPVLGTLEMSGFAQAVYITETMPE